MLKNLAFFLGMCLLLAGCESNSASPDRGAVVARADQAVLYLDDLKDIVPLGTNSKDSAEMIRNFVDNWVRESLVIQKAENNLTEEQKNVEKQLQDYRNSLITYIYEKELVNQKLDTVVSPEEVEAYYTKNQNDFQLRDNIVKVVYVKVSKKAPGIDKLRKWYQSDNMKDREQLASYCHQFASNFYLDDNSWLFFDDLLKEIPIQTYNKELFLQNNKAVEVSDSLYNYFLAIKGFKVRNSISPLSFETENIRNIILNKRKLELISKMKEDVYNDAANNKKIEIDLHETLKK